jgi:hypothetical protein
MTIGAPAYATRKKSIEDREELVMKAMLDRAATFDLARLNTLIATHNRYYPIEANLSTDMRTGEYLVYGRPWLPTERFVAQAKAVIAARA